MNNKTPNKTPIEEIKENNSYDKVEKILIEYGIQDALFFDSFHELARELNSQLQESNEKYLDEFKEYLKVKHNMPAYYVTDRYHPYSFELFEEFKNFKKEVRENG